MYERNAIVLERYFNQMFGYNLKNNIKANFIDYCEFIECLERYYQISEEEESIVNEYDLIASKITEVQQKQDSLNKKNDKLQKLRMEIFSNIDDNSESIQRKIFDINNSIQSINEEIKENAEKFVEYVSKFNEKTSIRTKCEKSMRTIEAEYNRRLNNMLDNYKDIDIVIEKKAKEFIETDTKEIEDELKDKIEKNGAKEKVPFSKEVIEKAISLCIQIQKNENRIFVNIYDKCNKLFNEIKNNTIKVEKHNKTIKDSKSELEFLNAMKEYLVQFLDNERLTAVNGEKDHNSLMKEACKNLDKDWTQINNLYTLLKKEITNKANKKSYTDLYNIDYLKELEKIAEEFDMQIKKLNLPVTIINPNYWRIEGMKKIYDVFNNCVTDNYGRDIYEFISKEEENENVQEIVTGENNEKTNIKKDTNIVAVEEKTNAKSEINKKIDLILGNSESNVDEDYEDDVDYFSNAEDINDEDDYVIEDEDDDDDDDDIDYDTNWNFEHNNDIEVKLEDDIEEDEDVWDKDEEQYQNNDDWDDEEFSDEWDNNDESKENYNSFIYDNKINEENENNIEEDKEEFSEKKDNEDLSEENNDDEKMEQVSKKLNTKEKKKKEKEQEEIDEEESKTDNKKGKHTKKGGFFSKFKK